jgi:hypothetical protein
MDYERVVARAALDGKDALDGVRVQRVGTEAVDRLSRKGDQAPAAEPYDSVGYEVQWHA